MRRLVAPLLLWTLTIGAAVAVPSLATAQASPGPGSDLPPGFVDGVPVGGTELPDADLPAPPEDQGAADSTRASSTRYFGQGPWDAINEATAATGRCDSLTGPMLTALVVSPIFKESSAATTASTAPSPMTLSRWDEWNGNYSTGSNTSANYGLYAFRNPYTAYPRAYWHSGIGIWQYDSAGVGAPYTAIERMNVRTVAGDVATGMASRYCNPSSAIVGHSAPFTTQERRDAAWWPWWAGNPNRSCPLCQVEYAKMTASSPYFANVNMVSGITATGGAVKRQCTLEGQAGTVECWYVDPSVGVIQGATGWATYSTDGKGSPTVAPSPLSLPFYVIKRNGNEERHWLKVDTGYTTDISGSRQLGKNERPRSNQSGSGITWSSSSGLCDLDTSHGDCTAPPPQPTGPSVPAPTGSNLTSTSLSVSGSYRTVALDANGDNRGDVLWYSPGAGADYLWLGQSDGTFSSAPVSINGTYDLQALDANGDGRDDLLFYMPDWGFAHLWTSAGNGTFTSSSTFPGAGLEPKVLHQTTGADKVFWYGPGSLPDALWSWTGSKVSEKPRSVGGTYQTLVGDFNNDGTDDLFWYAPGADADYIWFLDSAGNTTSMARPVNGTYTPIIGDFDGKTGDDILWYAPGLGTDTVWFNDGSASFTGQSLSVNDTYEPVVVDLGADGRQDIVWNPPGDAFGFWTRWTANGSRTSSGIADTKSFQAIAGRFSGGGADGILWYAPGNTTESLWRS